MLSSRLIFNIDEADFDRHEFLQVHAQFSAELKELIDTENMIENMAGPRIDKRPKRTLNRPTFR